MSTNGFLAKLEAPFLAKLEAKAAEAGQIVLLVVPCMWGASFPTSYFVIVQTLKPGLGGFFSLVIVKDDGIWEKTEFSADTYRAVEEYYVKRCHGR